MNCVVGWRGVKLLRTIRNKQSCWKCTSYFISIQEYYFDSVREWGFDTWSGSILAPSDSSSARGNLLSRRHTHTSWCASHRLKYWLACELSTNTMTWMTANKKRWPQTARFIRYRIAGFCSRRSFGVLEIGSQYHARIQLELHWTE